MIMMPRGELEDSRDRTSKGSKFGTSENDYHTGPGMIKCDSDELENDDSPSSSLSRLPCCHGVHWQSFDSDAW